jgi:hypothetical protein
MVADGTAVLDLADVDPLMADVSVPERHVARLAVGQTVRLTVDATGEEVAARIERIAPGVDPASGTVKVTLALSPRTGTTVAAVTTAGAASPALLAPTAPPTSAQAAPSPALRPGAFVRVAVVTETHEDALVVPRAALVAQGPRWCLFRRAGPDRVERLDVELGFEEGDLVEVARTTDGRRPLGPGDEVVVAGAAALSDGARVDVLAAPPP